MRRATNYCEETERALVLEQIQSVCRNACFSIPLNCILAASICRILRQEADFRLLVGWTAGIIALNVVRFVMARAMMKLQPSLDDGRRALRWNVILSLASGVIWAIVPGAILSVTGPNAAAVYFILAGLTAGAALQAGAYAWTGFALSFPIFGTLIVRLLMADAEGYMLAFDAALYTILIYGSGRRSEKGFIQAVLLKIEATTLATSLDREHNASKAAAARFFELANHDMLTGIGNRVAFSSQLETRLGRDGDFYLFLLDLDHFKSINDTLGHSTGDRVLEEVARRLVATISDDQSVARLGGDEFAILLANPAGKADEAEATAVAILSAFGEAFQVEGRSLNIGVSVGIAKYPEDGTTAEDLLAHADLALYATKDGGRHGWRRFDAGLLDNATMMRDIGSDLVGALAEGALDVYFQPQIDLDDDRLVGLEALIRWNHPVHGFVPPPLIVSAARQIRKQDALTGFVLDRACRQLRCLEEEGRTDIVLAINVSPSEFGCYSLPDLIKASAERHRIDCRRLEVEITEEAFVASDNGLAELAALSTMGVRLAIDDFGTGNSSIAYLRRMHVDRIKIDRSFITNFEERDQDRILVQAILGIGRSFGIEVLAEGVESERDIRLLRSLGCAVVQGYHFGRPMAVHDLAAWMAARSTSHRGAGGSVESRPACRLGASARREAA